MYISIKQKPFKMSTAKYRHFLETLSMAIKYICYLVVIRFVWLILTIHIV